MANENFPRSLTDVVMDPTTVVVPLDEGRATVRDLIAWLRVAPPEALVFLVTPQSHPNALPLQHVLRVNLESGEAVAAVVLTP